MLIEHDGKIPQVHESARIAPNAVLCGAVTVGAETSIGFGAVLTAESGPISIGKRCIIMDNAVLRGSKRHPLELGDNVLVGPQASLSGCQVADDVFIATGASIFNGARLGPRSEVRINGVVHIATNLPADATVPIGWVAVGDPARILPPDQHDDIWEIQEKLDFPKFVFGLERPEEGGSIMPEVGRRYTRLLQGHKNDRVIGED